MHNPPPPPLSLKHTNIEAHTLMAVHLDKTSLLLPLCSEGRDVYLCVCARDIQTLTSDYWFLVILLLPVHSTWRHRVVACCCAWLNYSGNDSIANYSFPLEQRHRDTGPCVNFFETPKCCGYQIHALLHSLQLCLQDILITERREEGFYIELDVQTFGKKTYFCNHFTSLFTLLLPNTTRILPLFPSLSYFYAFYFLLLTLSACQKLWKLYLSLRWENIPFKVILCYKNSLFLCHKPIWLTM